MNLVKIFLVGVATFILGGLNAHATVVDVFALANSSTGGSGAVTGINVNIGDHLVMNTDVNDCWSAGPSPRVSNADGLIGSGGFCQPTSAFSLHTQDGVTAAFGSLMAKIGAGNFFFVGTAFDQITTTAGALSLYYWDSDFANNSGSVAVSINLNPTQSVPEPGVLGLLGFGLLGLSFFRRKI